MKTLYDVISKTDPKKLWNSLNLTMQELTPEKLDAFFAVYKKILDSEPQYQAAVLQGVDLGGNGELTEFVYMNSLQGPHQRELLYAWNLEEILGIHIPESLNDVCQTLIVDELFRNLIRVEMEKPEYKLRQIHRELRDEIHHKAVWKKRCSDNRKAFYKAVKSTAGNVRWKTIRKECQETFPEIDTGFYWDSLIEEASFTEEFCRSLLPSNPPSLAGLYKAKRIIEQELQEATGEPVGSLLDSSYKDEIRVVCVQAKIKELAFRKIIVGKNYIPGVNIPIIYMIDEEGIRKEIVPGVLSNPLSFKIIVQDKRLLKDRKLLAGYLLLYLAYPLRMQRVMKELLLQELTHLFFNRMKQEINTGGNTENE